MVDNRTDSGTRQQGLVSARQMIIVVTPDWDGVDGLLRRFERGDVDLPWQETGGAVQIVVGRNGLAWASSMREQMPELAGKSDPVKREGDGKSPAGIFTLSSAFGYADATGAAAVRMPYRQATPTVECVDDSKSVNYNRIVDSREFNKPDWNSSEQMRRQDEQYRWGVVVDHNYPVTKPDCGSCIFLHIWTGKGKGTAGCTAMEADNMRELLFWLDPSKKPVMVQLREKDYKRLKVIWRLP